MARGPSVVVCEIEFPDQSSSLGLCMGSTAYKQMIGASPRAQLVKESACIAGDPGLIPGLARSAGEGIGYPLQYSWVSLVAHLVKNPSAMWRPGFSPWVGKIPWRRERLPTPVSWPGEFRGLDHKELDTTEQISQPDHAWHINRKKKKDFKWGNRLFFF